MKLKKTKEGFEIVHKGITTNFVVHLDNKVEVHPYNWIFGDISREDTLQRNIRKIAETLLFISKIKFKKEEKEIK